MSRVVSADVVAWVRLCLWGICRRSPRPARAGFLRITSWLNARSPSLSGNVLRLVPCYDLLCEVSSVVLFFMRPCLYPSLRGRPRTVGRVRARAPERPTPIKSVRSSCGTPRRSIIAITPGREARSRGHIELAGSRRDSRARRRRINTVTGSKVSPFPGLTMLHFTILGGGQGNGGNRPERRARARRGMRVGPTAHPCSLRFAAIPL